MIHELTLLASSPFVTDLLRYDYISLQMATVGLVAKSISAGTALGLAAFSAKRLVTDDQGRLLIYLFLVCEYDSVMRFTL